MLALKAVCSVFLLVAVWQVTFAGAQNGTCVPWTGQEPRCNVPVGTPIFVLDGLPVAYIFGATTRIAAALSFLRFPEPCYSAGLEIACTTNLRPCIQIGNETLPYPRQNCKHLCTSYVADCRAILASFGSPLATAVLATNNSQLYEPTLTCNELDPFSQGVPYFPEVAVNYTINGTVVEVPCWEANITVSTTCQSPLVPQSNDRYCNLVCPLPSLTDSQYESAKIMQGIVAWISWFLSAFLALSYLTYPAMRRFPKNLIAMTAVAANVLAGGMVLPTLAGSNQIWCGGEDESIIPDTSVTGNGVTEKLLVNYSISSLTFFSGGCSLQGAMILFGFLACTFWWVIIAFNMCLEMFLATKFGSWETWIKWIRIGIYHTIGWGLPFLFIVIPTSAGKMGFEPASTFCFITSEDNNAWSLTFFFIPVGISLVLGSVLFMICLIRLLVVAIRLRKIAEVVVPYTRVIIFIFIFFLVISLFVAYVINNAANESTITNGYELYYECISGTTFTPPSQCTLDSNVSSFPLVMLKGFAASCLGFLLFFNFMSWTVLKHWASIFVGIFEVLRKRNKKALEHLFSIVGGESFTSSSGLSASLSVGGATGMAEEDDKIERGQGRDEEEDEESKEESGSEEVASSSSPSDSEN